MSDETRANATVFDYLRWRGDLTLAQDGFNEVDSLILCIISYINLKKLRQLDVYKRQRYQQTAPRRTPCAGEL